MSIIIYATCKSYHTYSIYQPTVRFFIFQVTENKTVTITCEEYIGYAHFYPLLEKDIFHHLCQDPIEVGTHSGRLSTSCNQFN